VRQIVWSVDMMDSHVLIGHDESGFELVQVRTGSSHWKFSFSGYDGHGRVRVGHGCNYNPLVLIEDIFQKIEHGIEMPVELNMDDFDKSTFSEEWS
jgi:hypothetical protein